MNRIGYNSALPGPPPRIARLPLDEPVYPVPYFVTWFDDHNNPCRDGHGRPDFRVVDPQKVVGCYHRERCWICGDHMGTNKAFVIGPMCAINRTTAEPASHYECAAYAVKACPFLTHPRS